MNEILYRIRTVFTESLNSGKSQTDIANIIDKTPQYVWKILNNDTVNPSKSLIKDVCNGFNINENWLKYGELPVAKVENKEFTDICRQIAKNDEKAMQAIMDYWKLSDPDKELFWKFIDKFMK